MATGRSAYKAAEAYLAVAMDMGTPHTLAYRTGLVHQARAQALSARGRPAELGPGENVAALLPDPEVPAEVDTSAPTAPQNLTASNLTATGVTLTWEAGTDNVAVAGYRVAVDGTTVVDDLDALTYNVTGLTASTSYTMTVFAKDPSGNLSPAATLPVTTTA